MRILEGLLSTTLAYYIETQNYVTELLLDARATLACEAERLASMQLKEVEHP